MKRQSNRCDQNLDLKSSATARCGRGVRYGFLALFASVGLAFSAGAQTTLFQENYDSPSGPNGDVYFSVDPIYNGITDGTGTGASFAGNSFLNGQIVTSAIGIPAAQSGTYFLFDNTDTGSYTSGMEVWGTESAITVTPDTNYTFSFYLISANSVSKADIQPLIDGVSLSTGVTTPNAGVWNQYSFTWNSGTNTTANLELTDLNANSAGNDFGIDTIAFTQPAPLPELPVGTLLLVGLGAIGLLQLVRRIQPGLYDRAAVAE
jgi:hypothetical protein